jgi:hypothetical protein
VDPFAASQYRVDEGPDLLQLVLTVVKNQKQTGRTKDPQYGVEHRLVPQRHAVKVGEHKLRCASVARDHRQVDETDPILEGLPD